MNTPRRRLFRAPLALALALLATATVHAQTTVTTGETSTGTITLTSGNILNYTGSGSAGSAALTSSGEIYFYDTATAATSTITNDNFLLFYNSSTAGAATITNNSILEFLNTASAGSAHITNTHVAYLLDDATADQATIVNSGAGATLDNRFHTGSVTVGAFSGTGELLLGTGNTAIGSLNTHTTFSGVISGTGGSLTKVGTGTLTLTGANTYTGGTTLSGGTLIATPGALGTGTVTLADSDTALYLSSAATNTLANPITVATGTGAATIGGASGSDFVIYSGNLTLNRPTTLADLTGFRTTFTGVIAGNVGTLTIGGGGGSGYRVTLEGTNTFTGNVSVSDGVILQLSSTGNQILPTGTAVNLNTSGQLWLVNSSAIGSLSGGASSIVQVANGVNIPATLTVGSSNTSTTFAGTLSQANDYLSLTKVGTGTLTLTGAAEHYGDTTVDGGALLLANSTYGTGAGTVTVNTGATFGGTSVVMDHTIVNSGGHLAPGTAGALTFYNGLVLNDGSILDFQLGTASSQIVLSSNDYLTGSANPGGITLNLANSGGFTAATYTLFEFSGAPGASSFDVSDFVFGNTIAGYTYALALNGSALELTATASAVPEPSIYAAILAAAALCTTAVRRRKTKNSTAIN